MSFNNTAHAKGVSLLSALLWYENNAPLSMYKSLRTSIFLKTDYKFNITGSLSRRKVKVERKIEIDREVKACSSINVKIYEYANMQTCKNASMQERHVQTSNGHLVGMGGPTYSAYLTKLYQ